MRRPVVGIRREGADFLPWVGGGVASALALAGCRFAGTKGITILTRTIDVVEYDSAWETAFVREAARLIAVFNDALVAIHHVGSTSIPRLVAKPIIDIFVVLQETKTIDRFSAPMQELGYRVRGECLDAEIPGTPGRFYFSKDRLGKRTHQVHACAVGHSEIADKLAFRDYLRSHPQRPAQYGAIKQQLAIMHRHDNIAYMRGKDAFIRSTLDDARQWAARGAVD